MANIKKDIVNRVLEEANYIIKTNKTIRETASIFEVSKSTVHKDLNDRLKSIDYSKYDKIKDIFENHISIRHINGGEATRIKYSKFKKAKTN